LSEAVRPRDHRVASLVGEKSGNATYYLVEDFHGFSTTVEGHAHAVQNEFGKRAKTMTMPVTTLRALCEQLGPATIDFLKIDVEGAERDVLLSGDWRHHRPKIVMVEAVAPVTMAPSWQAWEPLLLTQGYRFASFDGLNRTYVAEEHGALAERLEAASGAEETGTQFRNFKPALEDATHPDHGLARLFSGADMVQLPLLSVDAMIDRLITKLDPVVLDHPIQPANVGNAHRLLFGSDPVPGWAESLGLLPTATVLDLYRSAMASAPFRVACGRISASYAW
jgi:hypothetical protein